MTSPRRTDTIDPSCGDKTWDARWDSDQRAEAVEHALDRLRTAQADIDIHRQEFTRRVAELRAAGGWVMTVQRLAANADHEEAQDA